MKKATHGARGATIIETAVAWPLIFIMVAIACEAFYVCYTQLYLDGAANAFAREYALGTDDSAINPGQAAQYVTNAYPDTAAANFQTGTPLADPAITPQPGVGFGSSQPDSRTGGVDYILPTQRLVTTTQSKPLTLFGVPVTSTGVGIEAESREMCNHFCINPTAGFTAAASVPEFLRGGGDDISPYYGGFQFMKSCNSQPGNVANGAGGYEQDGTLTTPTPTGSNWDSCPSGQTIWRALGHAEHLDSQNYNDIQNGVYNPHSGFDTATYQAFFEVWCHRKFYARMALVGFEAYPTMPTQAQLPTFLDALFGPPTATRITPNYGATGETGAPGYIIYQNGSFGTGVGSPTTIIPGWDATGVPGATTGSAAYQANDNPADGCNLY